MKARRLAVAAGIGGVSIAALTLLRDRARGKAVRGPRAGRLRFERGMAAVRLAARGGARYATSAPRLFASAGEHREALRNDLALQTAEDVAATLGTMKGVLMKLGQMASYVDDGMSPAARRTLSRLQDGVPPMSPELAAQVVTEELGQPPERAFATWDPEPIAAASIGQVHRAITHDGRAVAVKVQYPGIAETIEADLGNVALLRRMLKITAPMQDVDSLLAELRERVTEELDYRREARNQQMFARYYAGHPTISVPGIVAELSTRRLVTSDLADGARFAELAAGHRPSVTWPPRRSTASCSAACTRRTPSTAIRTRGTTCSRAAAGSPSWTSAWSSTSPPTSCGRWCRWSSTCAWRRTRRASAGPWRTQASWCPTLRCPRT